MINRREFLRGVSGMLAAGVAAPVVGSGVLMPVKPPLIRSGYYFINQPAVGYSGFVLEMVDAYEKATFACYMGDAFPVDTLCDDIVAAWKNSLSNLVSQDIADRLEAADLDQAPTSGRWVQEVDLEIKV